MLNDRIISYGTNPMHPEKNTVYNGNRIQWEKALVAANTAIRCGAKTRSSGPCKSPAMPNGRCRMHGGKSTGAPCGADHGQYKHGKYTNQKRQENREVRQMIGILKADEASICLADIGFASEHLETQEDFIVASDEIWKLLAAQELSHKEYKILMAELKKRNALRKNVKS